MPFGRLEARCVMTKKEQVTNNAQNPVWFFCTCQRKTICVGWVPTLDFVGSNVGWVPYLPPIWNRAMRSTTQHDSQVSHTRWPNHKANNLYFFWVLGMVAFRIALAPVLELGQGRRCTNEGLVKLVLGSHMSSLLWSRWSAPHSCQHMQLVMSLHNCCTKMYYQKSHIN